MSKTNFEAQKQKGLEEFDELILISRDGLLHKENWKAKDIFPEAKTKIKSFISSFVDSIKSSVEKEVVGQKETEVYISGKVVRQLLERFRESGAIGLIDIKVKAFVPKNKEEVAGQDWRDELYKKYPRKEAELFEEVFAPILASQAQKIREEYNTVRRVCLKCGHSFEYVEPRQKK